MGTSYCAIYRYAIGDDVSEVCIVCEIHTIIHTYLDARWCTLNRGIAPMRTAKS